jgi:hypothetical protein
VRMEPQPEPAEEAEPPVDAVQADAAAKTQRPSKSDIPKNSAAPRLAWARCSRSARDQWFDGASPRALPLSQHRLHAH